ncbi:MAG: AAA family ATPase, partial [Clostridiales bacterium]|nr:AAA family ATPase [Clostridiales bacterium]
PPPEEPEPDLFSTYPEKPAERPKNPTPPPTRPAQNAASGKPAQQAVQTASGFTTKNAVKEVTADTIEKWYKPMPNHGFDDVVGMEELKARLVREAASIGWTRTDDVLKISPLQSYLFYGPPGTGKTFLIEAFAHKLMEEHGFKFLQLSGGDIHASLVGVAEKTVDIAFQEAIDNAPCILFIDEFEEVCKSRNQKAEGHEKRLTVAFLEAYSKLKESDKRVVFMGATNHPGKVDGAMMSRLKRRILIPLPEEKAKEAYFARKFGSLALEDGFTFEDMAETTDNYSYRDLDSLHDIIAAQMKQEAIEDGQVRAADGSVDLEKSDIAVSEALKRGDVRVTKELFQEAKEEQPPTDQTEIRKELEEFERSVRAGGGQ